MNNPDGMGLFPVAVGASHKLCHAAMESRAHLEFELL